MAGSIPSRILVAAVAVVSLVASSTAAVALTAWRRIDAWLDRGAGWLVARMPKQRQEWVGAWHRILAAPVRRLQLLPKRKPVLSTRWRFCPSV